MLSLFMASMEATVVATAMPTIVGQLGGLASYSWVFSIYLLASTTTVPIFGKLSDLFGRRRVYLVAMGVFLVGSILCGRAGTMQQLIAFRAVQGLGAGGVLPLAFIIVGALFTYEQRVRVQSVSASVWGASSIIGPLLGGFLVDHVSWRWVFYVNVIPGLLAAALIWFGYAHEPRPKAAEVRVDYLGASLLTAGIIALLLGLFDLRTPRAWVLLGVAAGSFALLARAERRAADPVLPLALFRDRLYAAALGHAFFSGCALFGSVAFVPLFVQAVLATSATTAGATLTALLLGWPLAAIVGSRLLLRVGFRSVALTGMVSLTLGAFLTTRVDVQTSQATLVVNLLLMGIGMGLSVPALLIAVQTSVPRSLLGTATSTVQFSRSIGGALGVGVMGVVLGTRLGAALAASGMTPDPSLVSRLLDPIARSATSVALEGTIRTALAGAIQGVFVIASVAAAIGLIATALAPHGRIAQLAAQRTELERLSGATAIAPSE